MGAKESGQAFLESVLSRLPEDRRAAAAELVPELAEAIGEGVMMREDYSRHMDGIRAKHQEQSSWWEANREAALLGQKAKEAGFVPGQPPPAPAGTPTDFVRKDELEQDARAMVTLTALTPTLVIQHFKEFGEALDMTALMADPRVSQIGLKAVYDQSVAQKRADAAKAATDAEVARRVEEGVQTALRSRQNPSYPSAVPAGSPLDGLLAEIQKESGKADLSTESLVDAYETVRMGGQI